MRRILPVNYRLARRNRLTLLKQRLAPFFQRVGTASDIITGVFSDVVAGREGRLLKDARMTRTVLAADQDSDLSHWCLYASYSPKSVVTEMVLAQLGEYSKAGFRTVFISMSPDISEVDMAKLGQVCTHVLLRKSFGRDFGAWAHAVSLLSENLQHARAILLTNDSNLGPLYPLQPWIDRCFEREGIVGLTESLGGGSHLQSYFLLANGSKAVTAMLGFLTSLQLSHSKWLMIRRGEIAFSNAMIKGGHFVGAVIDYEMLENAVVSNPALQAELEVLFPGVFTYDDPPDRPDLEPAQRSKEVQRAHLLRRYRVRQQLFHFPLNPSHQLGSVLVNEFRFPFIKTELVVKNPGLVPSAPDWRYVLSADSPVSEAMIEDHLAAMT